MRTFIALAWLVLSGLSAVAAAEPSTRIAWTPQTLNLVKSGDPARGQTKAASCQSCHGADPANAATPFPYLNGQLATYLYRQLQDYKAGGRPHPIMTGIAAALSDQDMADIAQWYSRQEPVQMPEGRGDVPRLVVDGDSKRLIAPCGICHGGHGQGEPVDTPRLSGQKASYLKETLLAYKSGQRHNDIYRRMRTMAERLSPEEIDVLANYYGGLR
ncbi:c-type cytochrome [Methylolobus aquaticus]